MLSACAAPPKVVTEVKTVEVQVPVRTACLTPEEIPPHPARVMRPEADVRGLAAGAVVELRAWEIYYEKVNVLLAGCAK
jgi:hypothetical protein